MFNVAQSGIEGYTNNPDVLAYTGSDIGLLALAGGLIFGLGFGLFLRTRKPA